MENDYLKMNQLKNRSMTKAFRGLLVLGWIEIQGWRVKVVNV